MKATLIHGSTPDDLRDIPDESVDGCVTDPPYGLGFMGKEWDTFKPGAGPKAASNREPESDNPNVRGRSRSPAASPAGVSYDESLGGHLRFQAWTEEWAREVFRVLKPGGYLLCSGAPRSYHRMACGIEDAGFEVRDCVVWIFGQGYPKSMNVGKAIDRELGAPQPVSGVGDPVDRIALDMGGATGKAKNGLKADYVKTEPNTTEAEKWAGWGTALKPAWEPVIVARKPLIGTVAQNVLKHGTGALNIDGCRIGTKVESWPVSRSYCPGKYNMGVERTEETQSAGDAPPGRWPANVIHDGSDEVVAIFPLDAGAVASVRGTEPSARSIGDIYNDMRTPRTPRTPHDDLGSASRFFYVPKASRADRDDGMSGFDKKPLHWSSGDQSPGTFQSPNTDKSARNNHPTVKPTDLMRYLCALVTPPNGTVLDPFMGSGSTGRGALQGGFNFIGVEREAEYMEIAEARIKAIAGLFATVEIVKGGDSLGSEKEETTDAQEGPLERERAASQGAALSGG